MVSLNNIDYEIKTPLENCTDMICYINSYCATNNIKNSKGEVIYIDANEKLQFSMPQELKKQYEDILKRNRKL